MEEVRIWFTWGREQTGARSQASSTIMRVLLYLERCEIGHRIADSLAVDSES